MMVSCIIATLFLNVCTGYLAEIKRESFWLNFLAEISDKKLLEKYSAACRILIIPVQ